MSYTDELSSFDLWKRLNALQTVNQLEAFPLPGEDMNMHVHTFFSYNGEGWSPSRIAVEMKKLGLYAAAICDFDVLQGLEEFLYAGDLLRLRTGISFESRVFFPEYASHEINSPGEPGVLYFMGCGFASQPTAGSEAESIFNGMLKQSHVRNRALIARVNSKLDSMALDYDLDVLPLTPMGNATERHIVRAYYNKSISQFGSYDAAADFWAKIFKTDASDLREKIKNANGFNDYLRSKLMKKGGLGYEQPTSTTFPAIDTVIKMIRDCRALPTTAWLDGSLSGEAKPDEQLDCLLAKGVVAVNIIPDRNWNFKDEKTKAIKVEKLNEYIAAAQARKMPIFVGTECNKPGQRLVDDFAADALAPHKLVFLKGANILVGQTRMLRFTNMSYIDEATNAMLPSLSAKNDFFAAVGALPAPEASILARLKTNSADNNLQYITDCARAAKWK